MSTPILSRGTSKIWIDNIDPAANDNFAEVGNFWLNTSDQGIFMCVVETDNAVQWVEITTV